MARLRRQTLARVARFRHLAVMTPAGGPVHAAPARAHEVGGSWEKRRVPPCADRKVRGWQPPPAALAAPTPLALSPSHRGSATSGAMFLAVPSAPASLQL